MNYVNLNHQFRVQLTGNKDAQILGSKIFFYSLDILGFIICNTEVQFIEINSLAYSLIIYANTDTTKEDEACIMQKMVPYFATSILLSHSHFPEKLPNSNRCVYSKK